MYPILLVPALMIVFVIVVWWRCQASLGFASEVIGRAPNMLPLDGVAVFLSAMVGYLTVHAWSGYALTFFGPLPATNAGTTVLATTCCFGAMLIVGLNRGDRFTVPTVAGLRESAIRTLLTLRILDRAEDILRGGRR